VQAVSLGKKSTILKTAFGSAEGCLEDRTIFVKTIFEQSSSEHVITTQVRESQCEQSSSEHVITTQVRESQCEQLVLAKKFFAKDYLRAKLL